MIEWVIIYLLIGVVLAFPTLWFTLPMQKQRYPEGGRLDYILGGGLACIILWPVILVVSVWCLGHYLLILGGFISS